jgi:hypothetical protein
MKIIRTTVAITSVTIISFLSLMVQSSSAQVRVETERPAFEKLSPEMRQIITDWLTHDCFVGVFDLNIPLKYAGAELEPVLWESYVLGPMASDAQARRSVLKDQYGTYQRWVASEGREALGESLFKQLSAITQEEFVDREMVAYDRQYRDAALAGLGVVCSDACDPHLQSIADDDRNPGRFAAIAARERLRERLERR